MNFTIPGKPFGKARPRKGKFGVYNPRCNVEFEKRVSAAYVAALGYTPEPTDKPIWLNIDCYYAIPKQTPKKKRELMLEGKIQPMIKPDLDNVAKSIMDALNGLAYLDDKQIVLVRVSKAYALEPHTTVDIGRYHNV